MLMNRDVVDRIGVAVIDLLETHISGMDISLNEHGAVDMALPVKIKKEGQKFNVRVGLGFAQNKKVTSYHRLSNRIFDVDESSEE